MSHIIEGICLLTALVALGAAARSAASAQRLSVTYDRAVEQVCKRLAESDTAWKAIAEQLTKPRPPSGGGGEWG